MGSQRKRKLHIDGEEWVWIGHENLAEIREPSGKKHLVKIIDLPGNEGWTYDEIERAGYKGFRSASMTPAAVKYHIETAILGKTLPPFVQKPDDTTHLDARIAAANAKHWMSHTHRVLRFSYAYLDENHQRVDVRDVEHQDVVPVEIIRDILGEIMPQPEYLMFTVYIEGKNDEIVWAHRRDEVGPTTYYVTSETDCWNRNGFQALIDAPSLAVV